jgi:GT2 family glycosyltransferase
MPGRVDQNPFMRRRPSRLRWASFRFSFSSYGIAALWDWASRQKQRLKAYWQARRSEAPSTQKSEREFIYAPHGAFFIFSRRYFEAGGYLDGNLFLYGEELSVAEICRSLGLPVIYEPSLSVVHNEHRSTGKRISRFSYECQKKALRYIRSHYLHARADAAS